MTRDIRVFALLLLPLCAAVATALPPTGIEIPPEKGEKLQKELDDLQGLIDQVKSSNPDSVLLLPDVEIFAKAVDYALRDRSFYHQREFGWAGEELQLGRKRAELLARGEHPWTKETGLVVRGFRSPLDGSPQPYGLVIPKTFDGSRKVPLYVWLHGRGDTSLDLQFIHQRMTQAGQIQPEGAIVLHPFGRYCNGFKSAGDVDVMEAVEAVCREYPIDSNRILLCGFSMGGAGVWHLGAHYTDHWAAMSPGAGFVDVRRYQHLSPSQLPAWYEQALWGVYDVPDYARNLLNLPLIAYSGELDKQKEAADIMEGVLAENGLEMRHIVGKGVAHKYEPSALVELLKQLKVEEEQGLNPYPREIHLQTRTLRYPRMHWLTVTGLGEHWRDAHVDAFLDEDAVLMLTTVNVTRLRIDRPTREWSSPIISIKIDGEMLNANVAAGWKEPIVLEKQDGKWMQLSGHELESKSVRKSPGLQGPIDDAFMEPFLIVLPTGKCMDARVDEWVRSESHRFGERWRTLFRGEPRVVDDQHLTDDMISNYNLILWGDPASNSVIAKIADRLPMTWDSKGIHAAGKDWENGDRVLAMIAPNPLDGGEGKYVVLNSGITFRQDHDRTNSLQNPKLPDWVIFDVTVPPNEEVAGRVVDAGFFDENWKYQDKREIGTGDSSP